jgi:hypothetical protein
MFHKMSTQKKMMSMVLATVGALSNLALADGSPGGSGGGNGVGNQLFDFVEVQSQGTSSLKDFPAYTTVVAPLLANIHQIVPGFAEKMEEIAAKKQWILSTNPLKSLDNGTLLDVSKLTMEQIGIQNEHEVLIYTPWMNAADDRQQGGLLMHEMIMGVYLSLDTKPDIENVRILNRYIFGNVLNDGNKLSQQISDLGLGYFESQESITRKANIIAQAKVDFKNEINSWFCANKKKTLRNNSELSLYLDILDVVVSANSQDMYNQSKAGANGDMDKAHYYEAMGDLSDQLYDNLTTGPLHKVFNSNDSDALNKFCKQLGL